MKSLLKDDGKECIVRVLWKLEMYSQRHVSAYTRVL